MAKARPPGERPRVIGVEDLNVSGMMKNRRLSRSIADASMRELRRQLACKCPWYGVEPVVVQRFEATSKPCSKCGWVKEGMTLSDLVFCREACGHTADRDENAADNMLLLAVSSTERINGRRGDVRPPGTRGQTPGKRQSERVV